MATRLIDLSSNPPASDKYTAIKERLTDTFDLSERERASHLLSFRPLGDSKPSMLMDKMLALLGGHTLFPVRTVVFRVATRRSARPFGRH